MMLNGCARTQTEDVRFKACRNLQQMNEPMGNTVVPRIHRTAAIVVPCLFPCGEGTVVLIVCCRYAYCCPEPILGKIIWLRSSYFVVTICYVQNCDLSYSVLGMTENFKYRVNILPYRVWDLACWW